MKSFRCVLLALFMCSHLSALAETRPVLLGSANYNMDSATGSGGTLYTGSGLVSGSVRMTVSLTDGSVLTIISDSSNKLYCQGKAVGLVTETGAWSFGIPPSANAARGDHISVAYKYYGPVANDTVSVYNGVANSTMASLNSAGGLLSVVNGLVPGSVCITVSCSQGGVVLISSDSSYNLVYKGLVVGSVASSGAWSFTLPISANASAGDPICIRYQYYRQVATYKVAFNANGGKGKMAAQTMTYGTAAKLRKNTFTRSEYVFAGWAVSKSDAKKGLIAYTNAQAVSNLRTDGGKTTLYAVWAKKTYKVAFYGMYKGVTGTMSVESFTYGKAKKLSANKFKRKGYTFKGWAKSKALAKKGTVAYKNKQSVKNLVTNGKTVKLYAVWKKK